MSIGSSRIYARRLRTLAGALERELDIAYNHRVFVHHDDDGKPTSACALGYAALKKDELGFDDLVLFVGPDPYGYAGGPSMFLPKDSELSVVEAAQQFFGPDTYMSIFNSAAWLPSKTRTEVVASLRERADTLDPLDPPTVMGRLKRFLRLA